MWEGLAKTFANDKDIVIAKIDAEAETGVAETYGIRSYPQIKFFAKGSTKQPVDYEGGRTEKDFVGYLNAMAGTHRVVGGGLDDTAGRISEMDELAKKFVAATSESEKEGVYEELAGVVASLDSRYFFRESCPTSLSLCGLKGILISVTQNTMPKSSKN